MKEFIKNIYKNTKRLLTGHDRVLVAVSTGLDSMVLLHMLLEMNVQVAIAHVNHGQREQSKDEELFIKNFAHENNIQSSLITLQGNSQRMLQDNSDMTSSKE